MYVYHMTLWFCVHVVMGNQLGDWYAIHELTLCVSTESVHHNIMIRHYTVECTDLSLVVNTHGVCVVCTNAICTVLF